MEEDFLELTKVIQENKQKIEMLEAQNKSLESEKNELVKQKLILENELKKIKEETQKVITEMQEKLKEKMQNEELLQEKLATYEQKQIELVKLKNELEQTLASQTANYAKQIQQERALIQGLHEVTEKFLKDIYDNLKNASLERDRKQEQIEINQKIMNEELKELITRIKESHKRYELSLYELQKEIQNTKEEFNKNVESLNKKNYEEYEKNMKKFEETLIKFNEEFNSMKEKVGIVYQLENELKELLKKVTEKKPAETEDVLLYETVYGIALYLRNPLGIIKSTAQLLLDTIDKKGEKQKQKELLQSIISSSERIQQRIEQFTSFVKPLQFLFKDIPFQQVIDEVIFAIEERAKEQKVQIVKKYNELPIVVIDAQKIREALLNIVVNALDAMPQGGILTITGYKKDDNVFLEIADTGCGVKKENIEHVFLPFFTTKENTIGLGLSYAKHIIISHNGNISLTSEEGKGTKVIVSLPV
jgi:C4-dicarboxylate-specific signal transduction histidine kinase